MGNKIKVTIDIDFIIRDWVSALVGVYTKQIDDTWDEKIEDLDKIWEYFKFPVYQVVKTKTDDPDIEESTLILDESKPYEINKNLFNNFINDNILEIFGHAKEAFPNAMYQINQLKFRQPEWDITLVAKAKGKLIASTLFFLSKVGCEIENIKFINNYTEFEYKDVDVLVTGTNPTQSYYGDIVVLDTPYLGEECCYDYKINSLIELYDLQL